jgi:hypothetical protein
MSETRPRALTPEELSMLNAPAIAANAAAPLRTPPGTEIEIEHLNPLAPLVPVAVSPTESPADPPAQSGKATSGSSAPSKKTTKA